MTITEPNVGAAGFVAALTASGLCASERIAEGRTFAVFLYTIEVGSRAGEEIEVGLEIPGDWPMSPPSGPHLRPSLDHPHGAVHPSPLGPDWAYWSRPAYQWPADRTVRGYLRHLRTLVSQI
ncbi:hypothetical protein [Paractinoplanes lichenicola]|uniref:Uncharacterized protein n=1 Tax=Paractinoplanes lichenicola TaxID=2802976 RepID=A0ABS1W4D0_9ACTN|nr:hypothetical protein [Actinoplanes lichenicola]MBL7261583.1 hypothetical protein [Actinoplanes lichenicola]